MAAGGIWGDINANGSSVDVGASSGGGSEPDGSSSWQPPAVPKGFFLCPSNGRVIALRIWWECPVPPPLVTAEARPTLSDIRSFSPQTPTIAGEPEAWALKGRPTNLIAPVEPHVLTGALLGRPAEVRFTPVTWHWDFGDGSAAPTDTGGATWEARSLPRFSETPTSHVYRSRGDVTVSLDVEFSAAYRYDGGDWLPIDGSLTVPAGTHPIRVVVGSTVLTDGPCSATSRAGC